MRWNRRSGEDDAMTNISDFPAKKHEKIIEAALYDLSEWYDGLIENGIDTTTIIGILELTKCQLVNETYESIGDD